MSHKQPSIIRRFPIVVGRHIQPDSILLTHDQFPRVRLLPWNTKLLRILPATAQRCLCLRTELVSHEWQNHSSDIIIRHVILLAWMDGTVSIVTRHRLHNLGFEPWWKQYFSDPSKLVLRPIPTSCTMCTLCSTKINWPEIFQVPNWKSRDVQLPS